MTADHRSAEVQSLRAFIDAKKRGVGEAEKRYDVPAAVKELRDLAAPLLNPEQFTSTRKDLYLNFFYREVVSFLLKFVAVHLEICFSERDRERAFDVFFDRKVVPSSRAIGALVSTLSAIQKVPDGPNRTVDEDAEVSTTQCVRLLEKAVVSGGIQDIVTEMLVQEQQTTTGGDRTDVIGQQVLVSQLSSLPDLIFNRCQRNTPAAFRPRRYFPTLCDGLFHGLVQPKVPVCRLQTFRMFVDKLTRIGQTHMLVQSWLRSIGTSSVAPINQTLFESLPESCHEQILLHISNEKCSSSLSAPEALAHSKYRLLAQIPPALCVNKHFQYVVVHKLLLRRPIDDFLFWRVLVDVVAQCSGDLCETPLAALFDMVLARWSQSDFAISTDYTVNASVCFFLRYSMQKFAGHSGKAGFTKQDWITKICKGVQDHMSHSLERVRVLGMRVGESLSHIIASEKPLNFGLDCEDPVAIYGCTVPPAELEKDMLGPGSCFAQEARGASFALGTSDNKTSRNGQKQPGKQKAAKAFILDPDELVLGDDDGANASDVDGESEVSSDGEDANSDVSLEAYDLQDDEEDLMTKRPLYLRDLTAGLLSDDDREKTEAALNEAEALLRRQPRDLKDKAFGIVQALLRLEDKYSTPQFTMLRSQALATVCALAPTQTLPYMCSQALEREQLLQSRIDVLQAMTSAAQELSERGDGYQRPQLPKTLLQEQIESNLTTRTMQSLKTRRWGYRRDPLAIAKRNAFAPLALEFFSPLLFGYVKYVQKHSTGSDTTGKSRSELEQTFLAHLLHTLSSFVECSGHAPQTTAMAKCLLEFCWSERANANAEVRRQVLFGLSRVLLVVPPALLQREMGDTLIRQVAPWISHVQQQDPDAGCREAARLLSSLTSVRAASLSII
uniref:Telomere length regulation protein conserved domain-containing protein n=1 Tax=Peronospora matthiolae TaxID=2874970 RepID=A0AAV1VET6_9STRA